MQKFLIIQTAYIGDVILATSLIRKIKELSPNAQVDFLLRKGNESILENSTDITNLFIWNKKDKYSSMFQVIRELRGQRYDATINVQRFFNSGLFTVLSGAKTKIGFDKNPLSFLFSHKIKHLIPHKADGGNFLHEVQRNAQLLKPIFPGFSFESANSLPLKLEFTQKDEEKITQIVGGKKDYLVIAPSSVWYTKQFQKEKWIEFLELLPEKQQVFYLGAPSDFNFIESLRIRRDNHKNLAGKLSLLQSALLMKNAKRVFVNDSAPLHLASAVEANTTAIFCSTVTDFGYYPLAKNSVVIEEKLGLTCRPCGLHGKKECPLGHFKCSSSIEVTRLLETIDLSKS